MEKVIIAFLIMFIIIGLLTRFFDRYAAFWFQVMVTNELKLIHTILASAEVPHHWRIKWIETRASAEKASAFWQTLQKMLEKWYVFRLERLIRSVQNSSFIKKQEKAEYLEGLDEILQSWKIGEMG